MCRKSHILEMYALKKKKKNVNSRSQNISCARVAHLEEKMYAPKSKTVHAKPQDTSSATTTSPPSSPSPTPSPPFSSTVQQKHPDPQKSHSHSSLHSIFFPLTLSPTSSTIRGLSGADIETGKRECNDIPSPASISTAMCSKPSSPCAGEPGANVSSKHAHVPPQHHTDSTLPLPPQ